MFTVQDCRGIFYQIGIFTHLGEDGFYGIDVEGEWYGYHVFAPILYVVYHRQEKLDLFALKHDYLGVFERMKQTNYTPLQYAALMSSGVSEEDILRASDSDVDYELALAV